MYQGVGARTEHLGYTLNQDDIRQKFTGYQKDNETNLDFAEARMYASNYGRFTAVDPLLASGLSTNPQTFNRYVYVMNSPLIYVDPNGEFPITIHVRAFAPFDWFGPGKIVKGDGNNRPFSTSSRYTSRIRAETRYETTGRNRSESKAIGSMSETRYGLGPINLKTVKNYSNAYFIVSNGNLKKQSERTGQSNSESFTGEGRVKYHLAGKDRAIIPGSSMSPTWEIDIHTDLKIATSQIDSKRMQLSISGRVGGDQFPAAEAFVTDTKGNSVMLGTFAPEKSATPHLTLAGDSNSPMISVDVNIVTNRDGVFLGVLDNGKTINLDEWNKRFQSQPTVRE